MPTLTPEQIIIVDCWHQFAYEDGKGGLWHGGLSTLEEIYFYLLENKIIYKNGKIRKK